MPSDLDAKKAENKDVENSKWILKMSQLNASSWKIRVILFGGHSHLSLAEKMRARVIKTQIVKRAPWLKIFWLIEVVSFEDSD